MPCLPWEREHLLCDEVISIWGHHTPWCNVVCNEVPSQCSWNPSTDPCNQTLPTVLYCPKYPRYLPIGISCDGWGQHSWERLLVHLWLCSHPSNGNCWPSAASPLYLHPSLGLAVACICRCLSTLQFSEVQMVCSVTQHSLLQLLLRPTPSSGKWGEASKLYSSIFLPGNGSHQTIAAMPLCSSSTQVTGFSHSMCQPFRQGHSCTSLYSSG